MTLLSTSVDTAIRSVTESDFVRDMASGLLELIGIFVGLIIVAGLLIRFWPKRKSA